MCHVYINSHSNQERINPINIGSNFMLCLIHQILSSKLEYICHKAFTNNNIIKIIIFLKKKVYPIKLNLIGVVKHRRPLLFHRPFDGYQVQSENKILRSLFM